MMDPRFLDATVPALLRSILALPNVQRAPGASGQMHSLAEGATPALPVAVYVNVRGGVGPWPASMTLQYSAV
ncbi:hypothetical protein PHLGIDRAFT_19619 [Phlebiopsis gigantea 11061_1 CR5-6]|uniref:Uncharacterized protein n=1 Tax=Phlebiopsis gigantea (strain 11061_1 CR5-6) TaxID=745531 RepID=A0A0C3RW62_PHLG1|nr:hypothetical protein PHLGIDRAFT_19619 [Phlebiopsis gigantea 11061_1 CR5-6]